MTAKFDFLQQWYPLLPVEDLDPIRPMAVTLLGRRLAIWRPRFSEQYCVFLDRCPHRLAPLSEGRVDETTGHLMCSYHGWQFDPQGICTRVPQAEHPEQIAQQPQQFCAVSLPCQQQNDLLWVWPDEASADLAAARSLPLSPQIDASQGFVWSSFIRDLEYDWQTLVENVADPSHVPFAHHGTQGNRDRARPLPIEMVQSTKEHLEVNTQGHFKSNITFEPPCRLEYALNFGQDRKVGLIAYCLPVAPGKSRIVGQFTRNFATRWYQRLPRWLEHLNTRNPVLDGDMILLHHQERALQAAQASESWKTAYTMPAQSDRFVVEFRRWFDRYCEGQLPWPETMDPVLKEDGASCDRRQLLDRYQQHTAICRSCSRALKTIQHLQLGLLVYFAIAIAVVALLPDALRLQLGLPLIGLALLGLGIYGWLKYRLEPKFYFVDYVHADK